MQSISGLSSTDFNGVILEAFFTTISEYLNVRRRQIHYLGTPTARRFSVEESLQSSISVSYTVTYANAYVAPSSANVSHALSSANFTTSYQSNILASGNGAIVTSLVSGISVGLLQVSVLSSFPTRAPTSRVSFVLTQLPCVLQNLANCNSDSLAIVDSSSPVGLSAVF